MIWVTLTSQALAILWLVYGQILLHRRVTKLERAAIARGEGSIVAAARDSSYRGRPGPKEPVS